MGSFQSRCRAGNGLTTEDTEITEDTDRRWHSLCEWSGLKIPHPTCKHARVRLFYPPILTRQDFARQSGKQDQCVAEVGADRRDAHRETEERCQFSVIPVFSHPSFQSSQFSVIPVFSRAEGESAEFSVGSFQSRCRFAPLREIHGGG